MLWYMRHHVTSHAEAATENIVTAISNIEPETECTEDSESLTESVEACMATVTSLIEALASHTEDATVQIVPSMSHE